MLVTSCITYTCTLYYPVLTSNIPDLRPYHLVWKGKKMTLVPRLVCSYTSSLIKLTVIKLNLIDYNFLSISFIQSAVLYVVCRNMRYPKLSKALGSSRSSSVLKPLLMAFFYTLHTCELYTHVQTIVSE